MPAHSHLAERPAGTRDNSHQNSVTRRSLPDLPEAPAAAQLHRYVEPATLEEPCNAVLERLFAHPDLGAIPVVDNTNTPVALIERHAFIEFFGRAFARELYSKKTIEELCAGIGPIDIQPLRIDADTSIDDI